MKTFNDVYSTKPNFRTALDNASDAFHKEFDINDDRTVKRKVLTARLTEICNVHRATCSNWTCMSI